jgi:thioredoxin-like negative regulator of GroEL
VYRAALELAPGDRDLIRALIGLLGEDADPNERAIWQERLLSASEGDEAAELALGLCETREALGDLAGAQRALELGFKAAPAHPGVRRRLERLYRDTGELRPLAAMLIEQAGHAEGDTAVALLREAATIFGEMLFDAEGAAYALRRAVAAAPQDTAILAELVRCLAAQGKHDAAVEETARALDAGIDDPETRAGILLLQADARVAVGDVATAVRDLEDAYAIDRQRVSAPLTAALTRLRTVSAQRGDTDAERATARRLVEVHTECGNLEGARAVVQDWLQRDPDDRDMLYRLSEMYAQAEQWDGVVTVCSRLIEHEEGNGKVAVALQMATAARRAGNPAAARPGLEIVLAAVPDNREIDQALRDIYEQAGEFAALAKLVLHDAQNATSDEDRLAHLRRAGDLLLQSADPSAALGPLEAAHDLDPDDDELGLHIVDALIAADRLDDARERLQSMLSKKKGRSEQKGALLHRLARLARAAGDLDDELKWLEKAFAIRREDGELAAEVAQAALERENYALAVKVFRTISFLKLEGPISPEDAVVQEGVAELLRGNKAKAAMLARKILRGDPENAAAQDLLERTK